MQAETIRPFKAALWLPTYGCLSVLSVFFNAIPSSFHGENKNLSWRHRGVSDWGWWKQQEGESVLDWCTKAVVEDFDDDEERYYFNVFWSRWERSCPEKNHQTQEASFCVFAIKPDLGASQTHVFSQLFKREGEWRVCSVATKKKNKGGIVIPRWGKTKGDRLPLRGKKPTTPGVPRRSPIQVLTGPEPA